MARATENSRRQHAELRRLADELTGLLEPTPTSNARAVQKVLSRLAGIIKVHVAMEVGGLYPQLLNHEDEGIRSMANAVVVALNDAYDRFLAFRSAWMTDDIAADPDTFIEEARRTARALHVRTMQEEVQLYDRVDEIYAELGRRTA